MKGIIYGSTKDVAYKKLDEIYNNYIKYTFNTAIKITKTLSEYSIIFDNDDIWIACTSSEYQRGRACNIAYIDKTIPEETIQTIIMPTLKCQPYRAYNFFWPSEDKNC